MSAPKLRLLLLGALVAVSTSVAAKGDPEVGRKKSTPCAVCHGPNGVSPGPEFPNLAGQHADYLEAAMKHYKNGKRKNPIMQAQVAGLTPRDMMDLAAFFATQRHLHVKR